MHYLWHTFLIVHQDSSSRKWLYRLWAEGQSKAAMVWLKCLLNREHGTTHGKKSNEESLRGLEGYTKTVPIISERMSRTGRRHAEQSQIYWWETQWSHRLERKWKRGTMRSTGHKMGKVREGMSTDRRSTDRWLGVTGIWIGTIMGFSLRCWWCPEISIAKWHKNIWKHVLLFTHWAPLFQHHRGSIYNQVAFKGS